MGSVVRLHTLANLIALSEGPDREIDLKMKNAFAGHHSGFPWRWSGLGLIPKQEIAVLDVPRTTEDIDDDSQSLRDVTLVPLYTANISHSFKLLSQMLGHGAQITIVSNVGSMQHTCSVKMVEYDKEIVCENFPTLELAVAHACVRVAITLAGENVEFINCKAWKPGY